MEEWSYKVRKMLIELEIRSSNTLFKGRSDRRVTMEGMVEPLTLFRTKWLFENFNQLHLGKNARGWAGYPLNPFES